MDRSWDAQTVKDLRGRLARIEGQVRGVGKMIEERRRCDQIVLQVMAARAALEKVAATVVAANVEECLTLPPDEARKALGASIGLLTHF